MKKSFSLENENVGGEMSFTLQTKKLFYITSLPFDATVIAFFSHIRRGMFSFLQRKLL